MKTVYSDIIISSRQLFESLFKSWNFTELIEKCDKFLAKKDLNEIDILYLSMLKSWGLIWKTKIIPEGIFEGFITSEKIFNKVISDNLDYFLSDATILYIWVRIRYDDCQNSFNFNTRNKQAEILEQDYNIPVETLTSKNELKRYQSLLDKCDIPLETGLEFFKPFDFNSRKFEIQKLRCRTFFDQGISQTDQKENLKLLIKQAKKVHNPLEIAQSYIWLGHFYQFSLREIDKALENYIKGSEILTAENSTHLELFAYCQLRMSNCWDFKGYFKKAYDFIERAEFLYKNANNHYMYNLAISIKGRNYFSQGDYRSALKCQKIALEFFETHRAIANVSETLREIGIIYQKLDMDKEAKDYFENSLNLSTDSKNTSQNHFHLIDIYLKAGSISTAQSHLNILQEIKKNNPENKFIQMLSKLAEAVLLKNSSRIAQITRSQQLINEILKNQVYYPYTFIAMILKAELLLKEFNLTSQDSNNQEIIEELLDFTDKMVQFEDEYSGSFIIEVLIIKAKLQTLQGNFTTTTQILQEAKRIVYEKEYDFLKEKTEQEINEMQELIKSSSKNTNDLSLKEKLENLHLENYLAEAKKILQK